MFKRSKRTKRAVIVGVAACALLVAIACPVSGKASPALATAPTLGTAASFAVLAGSTLTNTGVTVVSGNLGVSPGTAVTGFPPGIVSGGTIHAGDAVAAQAQSDALTAYNSLAGQPCNFNLTGQDLGGKTLIAGAYCFSTSAQLTGRLTLNGQGNPGSVFIFQIGSTLTTASASSVLLINGASSCNVYWQVGSSATLGTVTSFAGSILARTSITPTTAATINGRALALNGAVTMDTNRVFANQCAAPPTATATSTATTVPTATATSAPVTSTATSIPATATATTIPFPTATTIPFPTATTIPFPTATTIPLPTATTIPFPTVTSIPATSTAIAATATAIAAATNTAVATPTTTATATATNTAIASLTATATAATTNTAVATPTTTAIAGATSTPVAGATATAVSGVTATPSKATIPRVSKSPTTRTIAISTRRVRHHRSPTAVSVPRVIPRTGAGGTSVFSAPRIVTARGAAPTTGVQAGGSSPPTNGVAALPRTGGGSGGGSPTSPVAPLVLLGGIAIMVGRIVLRVTKR